jgi:tetratricopeptide (TPR) repeat protein
LRTGRAPAAALWIAIVLLAGAWAPPGAFAQPPATPEVPPADGAPETALDSARIDPSASTSVSPPPAASPRPRRRSPAAADEIRPDARTSTGRTGKLAGNPAEPRAASATGRTGPVSVPRDLEDLNGWLEYKSRARLLTLPLEARLFYRRGLLAHHAGRIEEGERWVRAAAELDPSFAEPHLTIAAWSLPGRPSQALVHWAAVLDLTRESFAFQAGLVANVLFLAFQSLLIALLIAGAIIVALRVPELTHPWRERLSLVLRPATARWWSLAFVVIPYLAGFGVVLPTIAFLGLLWPSLRARERAIFVLLTLGFAGIPWTSAALERLATPLDPGAAPLHGVALMENQSWSADRQRRLAGLAERSPENPFLQFALAWVARRGGDLATAERGYRKTLERWNHDDRVLTNLGNVLAMQGRQEEALETYARASTAGPRNPAPHFNESQIYTQRFEYMAATEALSRASSLDFDLVRRYQSLGSNDGGLALVDQWIAPANFWRALAEAPGMAPSPASVPPSWRGRLETSGWRFTVAACLSALIAALLGAWGSRGLPLRACNNCGRVVCRRCAQRRREVALCRTCSALETRAQNADFARVLLRRNQRQSERLRHVIRTVLATLIPGFGLLAFRRAITPVLLIAVGVLIAGPLAGVPLPFDLEPRLAVPDRLPDLPSRIGFAIAIYAISIGGYLSCVARARVRAAAMAAAAADPATQSPRRVAARAA